MVYPACAGPTRTPGAALGGEALGGGALRRKVGRDSRARSTVQTVAAASSAEGVQRGPDGNGNSERSVLGDAGGEGFTRGGREGVSHGLTTIYAPQNPREFSAPLVTMLASLAVVSRPAPEAKYRAAMLAETATKQALSRSRRCRRSD